MDSDHGSAVRRAAMSDPEMLRRSLDPANIQAMMQMQQAMQQLQSSGLMPPGPGGPLGLGADLGAGAGAGLDQPPASAGAAQLDRIAPLFPAQLALFMPKSLGCAAIGHRNNLEYLAHNPLVLAGVINLCCNCEGPQR